jgi:predicted phosphoribosyltransferase
VKGREILLVDDVMTTGATAWECARELRQAGAAKVWVVTPARALSGEVQGADRVPELVSTVIPEVNPDAIMYNGVALNDVPLNDVSVNHEEQRIGWQGSRASQF